MSLSVEPLIHVSIEADAVQVNGQYVFRKEESEQDFFKQLYNHLGMNYLKFYKMDQLSKLGVLSCECLFKAYPIDLAERENVLMVCANSGSSIDTDKKYLDSIAEFPSPALFVYTLSNIVQGEISIRHKIYEESTFFILPHYDEKALKDKAMLLQAATGLEEGYVMTAWIEYLGQEQYASHTSLYSWGKKN